MLSLKYVFIHLRTTKKEKKKGIDGMEILFPLFILFVS